MAKRLSGEAQCHEVARFRDEANAVVGRPGAVILPRYLQAECLRPGGTGLPGGEVQSAPAFAPAADRGGQV